MPEHDNFDALIREMEPNADESVPPDVREVLQYVQYVVQKITEIESRTGRTTLTAKAKQSAVNAARMIAIHHAIGGKEE